MAIIRLILVMFLAALLTACSVGNPNAGVIEQAIALQLSQTQTEIGQLLYRNTPRTPKISVNHVKVSDRQSFTIQSLKAYHVQGTYDLSLTFPDHRVAQTQNPFDLYLKQQGEAKAKTWYLLRPTRDNDKVEDWDAIAINPTPTL